MVSSQWVSERLFHTGGVGEQDEPPRVRELTSDAVAGRAPASSTSVVLIVGVLAAVALLFASTVPSNRPDDGDAAASAPTSAASIVTEPTPATTGTSAAPISIGALPSFDDFIAGAQSRLWILSGGSAPLQLQSLGDVATSTDISAAPGPWLEFDESGELAAWLGSSQEAVFMGDPVAGRWLAAEASSFRWHATVGRRIAWLVPGPEGEICRFLVEELAQPTADLRSGAQCVPGAGEQLLVYDEDGFVVFDGTLGEVVRLDFRGERRAAVRASNAIKCSAGGILLAATSDGGVTFMLAGPDLSAPETLDWAPRDVAGEYGFVACSPAAIDPKVAFLRSIDGEPVLEVYGLDGSLRAAVPVTNRVWDVTWDDTGRFVLLPGTLDESPLGHAVQVYDTVTHDMRKVPADDWIHDGAMVTPRPCVRAGETAAIYQRRLPDGVELADSWMVRSREPGFGFTFVSARVVGGANDGEVATWFVYGVAGTPDPGNTPTASVPMDDVARSFRFGDHAITPDEYGLTSWFDLDGAASARACVEAAAP